MSLLLSLLRLKLKLSLQNRLNVGPDISISDLTWVLVIVSQSRLDTYRRWVLSGSLIFSKNYQLMYIIKVNHWSLEIRLHPFITRGLHFKVAFSEINKTSLFTITTIMIFLGAEWVWGESIVFAVLWRFELGANKNRKKWKW